MSDAVRRSYDAIAGDYAGAMLDELRHKPFDRALLDRFTASLGAGRVCDLGCGPGQVAGYLHAAGLNVFGLDLSPGMIGEARRAHPAIPFGVADLLALPLADASLDGIAAFYAIVNLAPENLPRALVEFARVLRPGGRLLLSFHVGDSVIELGELWNRKVELAFRFFSPAQIGAELEAAGIAVETIAERPPYLEIEYRSHRAYALARRRPRGLAAN